MVLNWIYPRQGGGWIRRYFRFRKDLASRVLESKDRYPHAPVSLFDFSDDNDAMDAIRVHEKDKDGWRLSDDRVIGGFSKSSAILMRSADDLKRFAADIEAASDTSQGMPGPVQDDFVPFLRWSGTLDTTIGLQSNAQRSGFAALRSPEFPFEGANLGGMYRALEIVCRSDGSRMFIVNLKVSSSIPDDIYQGRIRSPPRDQSEGDKSGEVDFDRFLLPFNNFRLTSMGRDREVHRELDDNICIESIGVALMDGEDGSFQLDLARIRAVNLNEDGSVFEGPP